MYLLPRVQCCATSVGLARVFVAEGAMLCAFGAGWGCYEISWRGHLLLRVQCGAPRVQVVRVGVVTGSGICGRGCRAVLPGHGLGGLGRWLVWASAVEGAGSCSLGTC